MEKYRREQAGGSATALVLHGDVFGGGMGKLGVLLAVVVAVLLMACGSGADSSEDFEMTMAEDSAAGIFEASEEVMAQTAEFAAAMAEPEFTKRAAQPERGGKAGNDALQGTERKVISTADITMKVEEVEPAINRVKAVTEGLGGYVEHLSTFGGPERVQASLTLRVPQDRFDSVISSIEKLGVVESRNLGSEDVSAEFIDLEARLKSSLREEESLLRLLERAEQVGEILAIERELFRVRTDIERVQGQLNFLEQRVDLATIYLNLLPLDGRIATPPSASLLLDVEGLPGKVDDIKGMVESVGGMVDRVYHSIHEDRERAELTILVYSQDFEQMMEFLEDLGDVKSKSVNEATQGVGGEQPRLGRPEAEIEVSLLHERTSVVDMLKVAGIVVGLLILGALVLLLLYRVVRSVFGAGRDGEIFTLRR